MRVTRTERPSGTVYRIYRSSESFAEKMKALIPFLLQVRQNVLIGDTLEDPRLVVTIAPLPRGAAQELDRRLRAHLGKPAL
ncbi:MAG: hypothetical protein H7276_18875 [Caulobacter sp.]|nr:hypothetical protein [Vitreoscilla sp.]